MTSSRAERIFGYLRAALDVEQAVTERHVLDGRATRGREHPLPLERGQAPLAGAIAVLPPSNRARDWAEARHRAARADEPETLWAGWPMVRGKARHDGRRTDVVAGLLVGRVRLVADGDGTDRVESAGPGLVLSSAALDLLGLPVDERRLLHAAFAAAVDDAADPLAAALSLLVEWGVL